MAYRRRYIRKRKLITPAMARVRRARRAVRYARIGRSMARTHFFKRMAKPIIVSNTGANNISVSDGSSSQVSTFTYATDDFGCQQGGFAVQSLLNAALDSSDFTALFDRYKIVGVKYKFLFQANTASVNTQGVPQAPLPLITYAFDADDNNTPANRTVVATKQYAKERILNGNSTFSVFYKPRITKTVFNGVVSSAYTSEKACWIDCANPSVPHYGMKLWINNWLSDTAQSNMKLTIQPTYYLACKDSQ